MRVPLWVLLAVFAGAARVAPAAQTDDDHQLEETVRDALAGSGVDTAAVEVEAHGGAVVLKGTVKDARAKLKVVEAVFGVAEVQEVESKLGVRNGVTPDLEEAVWSELLKDGLDGAVAEVIVRDGVAVLKGQAADEATRDRVVAIAKGVPGIQSVDDAISVRESVPAPAPEPVAVQKSTTTTTAPPPPPTPSPAPAQPAQAPEPLPEPTATAPQQPPSAAPVEPVPEPAATAAPEQTPSPTPPPPPAPPPPEPVPVPETPTPPAPPPSPPAPRPSTTPSRFAQQVAYTILTYPGYTVFDEIEFGIDGSDVFLRGTVTKPSKKRELEERIKAVSGVVGLQSDIRILPESKADDQLRQRLFRRIYEDPMFAEHAKEPNPPIHIIVDQGWVTLTGVVDKLVQKMSAEALVRNVFEVVGVKNRIRIRDSMAPRR